MTRAPMRAARSSTALPIAATTPHGSCPAITGPDTLPSPSEAAPPEARENFKSLPHMPDALISTTTSCGPGVGSGNSISCNLRSPRNVTPRMVGLPGCHDRRSSPYDTIPTKQLGEAVLKVVSFCHQGRHGVGVVAGNGLVALNKAAPGL